LGHIKRGNGGLLANSSQSHDDEVVPGQQVNGMTHHSAPTPARSGSVLGEDDHAILGQIFQNLGFVRVDDDAAHVSIVVGTAFALAAIADRGLAALPSDPCGALRSWRRARPR